MTDIDSRIENLMVYYDVSSRYNPASVSAFPLDIQNIADEIVAEETAELRAEVTTQKKTIAELTAKLSSSEKDRLLATRAHVKQITLAHNKDEFLHRVVESKNPIIRFLAWASSWEGTTDRYTQLKYDSVNETLAEMDQQDIKWGPARQQENGTGPRNGYTDNLANLYKHMTDERFRNGDGSWADILLEEVYEALAESNSRKLRAELNQVAAVCLSWIVSLKLQRKK